MATTKPVGSDVFRTLLGQLLELGSPGVDLVAEPGSVRVLAKFGAHRFMIGEFAREQIPGALAVFVGALAAPEPEPEPDA